ncbi:hypothetical protein, partial [Enterobacter asburiae]
QLLGSQNDMATIRLIGLVARKQACEQINEMFGLNIDVRFRVSGYDELDDYEEMYENEESEEVIENE